MAKNQKVKEETTIEEITSQEDFKQFIAMMEVTGQIEDFDKLATDAQRDVINKFYLWKEKGSPKAEMPTLKDDKEDEILKLYRVKHRGVQYIWYMTKDGRRVGMHYVHTYATEDEWVDGKMTGNKVQTETITSSEPKYEWEYTKELGEKLLALATKYNDFPSCYFVNGPNNKVKCSEPETEFNVDGKEMLKLMAKAPGHKGRRV
jgi:hypothetical protein